MHLPCTCNLHAAALQLGAPVATASSEYLQQACASKHPCSERCSTRAFVYEVCGAVKQIIRNQLGVPACAADWQARRSCVVWLQGCIAVSCLIGFACCVAAAAAPALGCKAVHGCVVHCSL